PKPVGRQGIIYGDKIINVANKERKYIYPREGGLEYVANGEIGVVIGEYKGRNWSRKGLPRNLEVEFSTQTGFSYKFYRNEFSEEGNDPLELAYALTIHKAQGSEFDLTFVIIPDPCFLLSRELIYTALTRHRQKVVIFHQGDIQDLKSLSSGQKSEIASRMTNIFIEPCPVEFEGRLFEDRLIHRTRRGEAVRSKSEVIIADLLYGLGIDYQYEHKLSAPDGSFRYPDFTIEDSDTGEQIFIEHLGMLHVPTYKRTWDKKVEWYRAQSISEEGGDGGLLLVTRDEPNGGIDSRRIEQRIREILGL
ncbi:MAG: ATP-binding domain-containing protein, partial [Woeseiaceae bacterium]|nr:ATP-binding domain-containing protein [Woeseiaceae bacterium]